MPEPVTPPKKTAEIGAEMIAEMIPQIETGDEDVGGAEVAPDEEQGDQADDRGDEEQRDQPAEDHEDRIGRRRASAGGAKNVTRRCCRTG